LYAASAFQNGTLKGIKIKFSGSLAKTLPSRRRSSGPRAEFAMELEGPILPHSFVALNELLSETQGGHLEAVYLAPISWEKTVSLNCVPTAAGSKETRAQLRDKLKSPSYGISAELASYLTDSEPLGPRTITRIQTIDGRYYTETKLGIGEL
jgi:hypothetical protein